MATQAQILANRRNVALSRGPKTTAGKNRSRFNALKHGLAARIARTPGQVEEIQALANIFEGQGIQPALARELAEQEIKLRQIRRYQAELETLLPFAAAPGAAASIDPARIIDKLLKSHRYEGRACAKRNRALR